MNTTNLWMWLLLGFMPTMIVARRVADGERRIMMRAACWSLWLVQHTDGSWAWRLAIYWPRWW